MCVALDTFTTWDLNHCLKTREKGHGKSDTFSITYQENKAERQRNLIAFPKQEKTQTLQKPN